MVQVLACDLALSDQAAAVAHRVQQRLESPALGRPAPSLAGEGDQGGAVSMIIEKCRSMVTEKCRSASSSDPAAAGLP